ncbi:MAG: hypothetical protein JSR17_12280, partial [Proteobacteria bacterium]|nr:hypothetical protein [Pseudomonadota bacterium]
QLLLTLKKEGMTIVVSSHILSELEDYSSHMIVLHEGKLVKQCSLTQSIETEQNALTLKVEFTKEASTFLDVLNTIPNIKINSIQNKVVILTLTGNQDAQQALLKTLIEKELPVLSIQEQKQSMQEMYLDIAELHKTKEKKAKEKKE